MSDAVKLTVSDSPRSTLTVTPDSPVFTGDTVNLKCVIESLSDWRQRIGLRDDRRNHWMYDWKYEWYKGSTNIVILESSERYTVNRDTLGIVKAITSDQDQYSCRGQREGRPQSSHLSSAVSVDVMKRPKAVVKVTPDQSVFSGERVTLTCVIQRPGDIQWRYYSWYKDGYSYYPYTTTTAEYSFTASESDSGEYSCRGQRDSQRSSDISDAVKLTVSDLKPKPELTSDPAGAVLTGNTLTLTCRMDPVAAWDFYWNKHTLNSENNTGTNSYRVKIDSVSDGGQFRCRAGRGKPVYYTQYSDALWVNVTESPKAVVTVWPEERVFRRETVSLRCDVKWGGDSEWMYRWEIEGTNWYKNTVSQTTTQELNISRVGDAHSGNYTCRGQMGTQCSQRSDAVTLTVSDEARAAVRVSPQPWLTEGDSVTLICEVTGSSTGWTFSWFRDDDGLSDSSRGAGGSYTLSPAALQHTGVYTCRAERGRPAYYTQNSSTLLWITGVSSSVSLVVSPSRSQHFSSHSLSLSCEDQSNSGWTVRRYTDRNTEDCSKQTGSCRILSLSSSDSGVYWCQSESGEKRHPLNITVHYGDVILESSVDAVIEGDTLTLRCLHRSTNSPIPGAGFYKDRSLVQNQTTGEMSITTVSKSHEGFYYCKTERGESPESWISVRVSASSPLLLTGVVVGSSVFLLIFISLLLLLLRRKKNKDQQRDINQSAPNQSRGSQPENSPLQTAGSDHTYDDVIVKKRDKGSDHIYDNVTVVNNGDKDDPEPFSDITYSEVTVKKKMDKEDTIAETNNVTYAEVGKREKKCKSKDLNIGEPSDLTYAQVNTQDKKKTKGKEPGLADIMMEMKSKQKHGEKSSESGDTLYSELKPNTDRGADAGDALYAQHVKKKKKTRP